jgi:hypothetical protein
LQGVQEERFRILPAVKKLFLLILLFSTALSASSGSFVGLVVNGPNTDAGKKWVFIQSKKGATRKVEISSAKVVFDEDVPREQKTSKPVDAIKEGARVRVTASQDDNGEWKASEVEVLKSGD